MTKTYVFMFLSVLLLAPLSAGAEQGPIAVHIDANKPASFDIPRTIFGSFLEPIGNSINNGLWAEILQNPSFEPGVWNPDQSAAMIQREPLLQKASSSALPLPWEALNLDEELRYEPRRGDAANSWQSLAVFGLPGHETGIKQQVYLPVHRELRYQGSLYVKHLSGANGIDVSIRKRKHPEQVFARAHFDAPDPGWRKYTFTLTLTAGQIASLETADFVITVEGNERAMFDQASLMPADALDGLDPEMVAMAKAMHTPLVRFGGNFTSAYHWRDGIGPRDKRISMLNIAWGMPEYNQFGTDEFLHFCELIGAEPQIALNLGSGTPEEAADWVRYVDEHWTKHQGLLWELGNELWGPWNLGYPTFQEAPARTLAFSRAVHRVDPDARLIATGRDPDNFQDWNGAQLNDPAGTFDFLSAHFVDSTDHVRDKNANANTYAADTFALPVELGRRLVDMQDEINDSHFKKKAHLAFTEWLFVCCDSKKVEGPRFDNVGGAITAGGFFNMLLRHADIVPVSDMTGIIEFAGIWKRRGRVYAAPAYYIFQMYSTADLYRTVKVANHSGHYDVHDGNDRLPEIWNVPYLDVVGALNRAGDRLTVFAVNRHLTDDLRATISLEGFEPAPTAKVDTLHAKTIYERNSETDPEHVAPVQSTIDVHAPFEYTFPHESVTRIELTRAVR